MLRKILLSAVCIASLALLQGCASSARQNDGCTAHTSQPAAPACPAPQETTDKSEETPPAPVADSGNLEDYLPIVIRVQGYGAPGEATRNINETQARLLAMRASRMDAYRTLAERVYGTRIQGNTSVQNLVTRDDNLRGYVDNVIRGAKILSSERLEDGVYVTEVELVLEPRIQRCVLRSGLSSSPECALTSVHGEYPEQRLPAVQHQPRARYQVH